MKKVKNKKTAVPVCRKTAANCDFDNKAFYLLRLLTEELGKKFAVSVFHLFIALHIKKYTQYLYFPAQYVFKILTKFTWSYKISLPAFRSFIAF